MLLLGSAVGGWRQSLLPLREKVSEGRMMGQPVRPNPSSPRCGPSPARGEGHATTGFVLMLAVGEYDSR